MPELLICLIYPGIFVLGLSIVIGYFYPGYFNSTRMKAWRGFAIANDLNFVPGNLFKPLTVSGHYRQHNIQLGIFIKPGEFFRPTKNSVRNSEPSLYIYVRFSPCTLTKIETAERVLTTEDVIGLFKAVDYPTWNLRGKILEQSNQPGLYYEQKGFESDQAYLTLLLQELSQVADAYAVLLACGSGIIPTLQKTLIVGDRRLQNIIVQVLRDIGRQTRAALSHQVSDLLCLACLTHYKVHKAHLEEPRMTITYCGCRMCHQSQTYFKGRAIAVLDEAMSAEQAQDKQNLRINWLKRPALFDFDAVEIITADDESVERFAVQVGNDTDPIRQPRYKTMPCLVASQCGLSENSLRVLQRTFGVVEIE